MFELSWRITRASLAHDWRAGSSALSGARIRLDQTPLSGMPVRPECQS
jgi:hypothetical protein